MLSRFPIVRFSEEEIERINAGKVKLELIPRGVGKIEVRAANLSCHQTKNGLRRNVVTHFILWWAILDSNQGPLACQASTLAT